MGDLSLLIRLTKSAFSFAACGLSDDVNRFRVAHKLVSSFRVGIQEFVPALDIRFVTVVDCNAFLVVNQCLLCIALINSLAVFSGACDSSLSVQRQC